MNLKNLTSVRKQIPKNLFYSPIWKAVLYFLRDMGLFFTFSFLILITDNIYFLIPIWILHGLSLLAIFQLSHDFAHGALLKNKKLAWWFGQICMLPVLHPFHQWVYGHNGIHHGNTSKLKTDLAWHPRSSEKYKSMNLLDKFFHRIYWSAFGTGIYYLLKMWLQGLILYSAPNWKAKRDIAIVLSFMISSSAFTIYLGAQTSNGFILSSGLWIFLKLQLIPFFLWNYTIGIIVYLHHINPDILWKKEVDWSPFYGQMQATTNYKLPRPINFFAHNIMVHSPHHVHTKIPFYNLPLALEEINKQYAGYVVERNSFWKDYWQATKNCKLIDSKTGKWIKYSEI